MATDSTLERLYSLRELQNAGYGNRIVLNQRINRGELPAVKVGNAYRIRESDLGLIAIPHEATGQSVRSVVNLDVLVQQVAENISRLTAEQKLALGHLLTPSAA